MSTLYRRLALSQNPVARTLRATRSFVRAFSIPTPKWFFRPLFAAYLAIRAVYYFLKRVFICEPFFKSHCMRYGRNVHTGVFNHWIMGHGQLIVGDDVIVDGKCSFVFAVRYTENPTLRIGSHVGIGHNSTFTIGREITIGDHVMIGGDVEMFDTPGHPSDPDLRRTGAPARSEDVRAIHVEDDAWIGSGSIIFPGVTVGKGSIVARGAMVMNSIPPYVIVAGSPARQIARLTPKEESN
jgi:acetyltransferase-like isoleucine patch superfamily enzyme